MNITKKEIDSLNAVLTLNIAKEDYEGRVNKILNDYKKTANIPGFRKGHVPIGMIKKQYGRAVLLDEINKLIQENLHKYLTEEKLDVLGNPLPKNEEQVDWNAADFSFEFELGLSPEFDVDVKAKPIKTYKIVADKKFLDNQIKTIQNQYGKLIAKKEVGKNDEITGTFSNEEKNIDKKATFSLVRMNEKKEFAIFLL